MAGQSQEDEAVADATTDTDETETLTDSATIEVGDGLRLVSENARRRGAESLRSDRPSMFFPIYIDEATKTIVKTGPALQSGETPFFGKENNLRPIWPIDGNGDERRWRWGRGTTDCLIKKGELVLGKHNKKRDSWTVNRIQMLQPKRNKQKTVWWHSSHSAGSHGSGILERLLGKGQAFPFPKSVYAVKDCLAAVTRNRPDALIVDFFAGSGTTFHATALLNAEDGGRRRCVLVTNNEVREEDAKTLNKAGFFMGDEEYERHGIARRVTWPRCQAVLTGKRPDGQTVPGAHIGGRAFADGFAENMAFFRLGYGDPEQIDLGRQFDAVAPLLWLAAGGIGDYELMTDEMRNAGFSLPPGSTYGVLLDEARLREFLDALTERPDVTRVFLVTDSEEAFGEMRAQCPLSVRASMLYRDYLRSFRLNTEGGAQ